MTPERPVSDAMKRDVDELYRRYLVDGAAAPAVVISPEARRCVAELWRRHFAPPDDDA